MYYKLYTVESQTVLQIHDDRVRTQKNISHRINSQQTHRSSRHTKTQFIHHLDRTLPPRFQHQSQKLQQLQNKFQPPHLTRHPPQT